jgi:hypothetical protein
LQPPNKKAGNLTINLQLLAQSAVLTFVCAFFPYLLFPLYFLELNDVLSLVMNKLPVHSMAPDKWTGRTVFPSLDHEAINMSNSLY